jgi:hypothetical protein
MKEHIPVFHRAWCPKHGLPSLVDGRGRMLCHGIYDAEVRLRDNPDKFKRKRRCDSRYERIIANRCMKGDANPPFTQGEET